MQKANEWKAMYNRLLKRYLALKEKKPTENNLIITLIVKAYKSNAPVYEYVSHTLKHMGIYGVEYQEKMNELDAFFRYLES